MRRLIPTIFLVVVAFAVRHVTGDACPKPDTDLAGNDIKNYQDAKSWQQCSQYCRQFAGCYAWTFVTEEFQTNVGLRGYCLLKNSNYMDGEKKVDGLISGVTECG